jgi:hypothetical protein
LSPVRIVLDENVSRHLATHLRSPGYDVDAARELRRLGLRDPRVLISAVELGQTLVTHNLKDVRLLHSASQILRNRREREVEAVAGFPTGLSGHPGMLVLPHGPLDEIAPALLVEILESGISLANRLLQRDRPTGWVGVND